jgi:two-component system nitrate/nitrite response regulator NarL
MYPSFNAALVVRNPVMREGLHRILADAKFTIVQSVEDPAALSDGAIDGPVLIILDRADGADGAGGCEQVRALRRRFPEARLVLLSKIFAFSEMVAAFGAGACGYIVKEISCEPLVASLRLVAMGEKVMPSDLADALRSHDATAHHEEDRVILQRANLSQRETEVLGCLILGWPNKTISRRLCISAPTVALHIKTILRKVDVCNRTQAAVRAAFGGLERPSGSGAPFTGK